MFLYETRQLASHRIDFLGIYVSLSNIEIEMRLIKVVIFVSHFGMLETHSIFVLKKMLHTIYYSLWNVLSTNVNAK